MAALLVIYWVLCAGCRCQEQVFRRGDSAARCGEESDFVAAPRRGVWMQHWLHTGVLFNDTRDPEGLLSTLPAVASTLLGSLAGVGMRARAE